MNRSEQRNVRNNRIHRIMSQRISDIYSFDSRTFYETTNMMYRCISQSIDFINLQFSYSLSLETEINLDMGVRPPSLCSNIYRLTLPLKVVIVRISYRQRPHT